MKFEYNFEKNAQLIKERGLGFEEIITEINNGNLVNITAHHNQEKYPEQKIMHIKCLGKIYLVPYVITKEGIIFLKTLFPSRKATKLYQNRK
jgi:uncharacterized DUF497 family protein